MIIRNCCRAIAPAVLVVAAFAAGPSLASGTHTSGHGASQAGAPGKAAEASRTVEVAMRDNFYDPESIPVKAGETVRFRVTNAGSLVHEFNIGTAAMHLAHQHQMQMMAEHGVLMPDRIDRAAGKAMQATMGHGAHDDPNSVLLEPGETAEIVWTFPRDGALEFACNVPGHYESGMAGDFHIVDQLAGN